jgi:hypothetical protein
MIIIWDVAPAKLYIRPVLAQELLLVHQQILPIVFVNLMEHLVLLAGFHVHLGEDRQQLVVAILQAPAIAIHI